ncbi:hypothetical protein GIB67_018563 [Kingdonia uniflora]|uniref:Uncharacterized protein n=1 Tax=Kingdonia uniflora TaxID=39325 RepID=A0A7J7NRU3_9MAGN|nr:hypothetical protein GIB67_018563 [Kingdonia uniflora]
MFSYILCNLIVLIFANFMENSKNSVTRFYEDKTQSNVTKDGVFHGTKAIKYIFNYISKRHVKIQICDEVKLQVSCEFL